MTLDHLEHTAGVALAPEARPGPGPIHTAFLNDGSANALVGGRNHFIIIEAEYLKRENLKWLIFQTK